MGDKEAMFFSYYNLGAIYDQQGDYANSAKQFTSALELKGGRCNECYIQIAHANIKLKKFADAKQCLDKALKASTKIGQKSEIRDSYSCLYELAFAQGNYREAYENYKLYIVYKDSLNNEENTKKMVQQQMQYDFDKKQSQITAEDRKSVV